MALSTNVGSFHSSCAAYVDNIPATGRFRFRSLLNKLEEQSKELRMTSTSGAGGNIDELKVTVKDLVAVIQR